MTDRPMDPDATEHPEEGLIHAWLDDALSAADAERLSAHVQGCAECQARVAEARGLIAGASRIVAALDDVPAGTRPAWAQVGDGSAAPAAAPASAAGAATQRSLWRWLRVTPARAALAATILVALGITLTHDKVAEDSARRAVSAVFDPQRADAPAAMGAEGAASDATKPTFRDELLDSAVAHRVAIAQGKATVGAAPGPSLPQAPPPTTTLQVPSGELAERVAAGRAKVEAERDAAGVAPDRARAGVTGAVASVLPPAGVAPLDPMRRAAATADRADGAGRASTSAQSAPVRADVAGVTANEAVAVARSCFRIDSPEANASWGGQPFPLVIALEPGQTDSTRRGAVLTATGAPTELRAIWTSRGDSVSVALRRIGWSGSIALGPDAGSRSGVAISASGVALEQVVATGYGTQAQVRSRADAPREEARKAAAPQASAAAPAPAPAPATAPPAGPPVRQLRVSARPVACPSR